MTLRSEAAPPAHASELPAVCALIRGGARLVTLTGLGHAGKSRLARATSRALAQEGLSWSLCDASSLSGVSELREALAAAAGASSRAPHLLVLDDLERLGGLDDDRRAHALVTCLTAAPALRLHRRVVQLTPGWWIGHER